MTDQPTPAKENLIEQIKVEPIIRPRGFYQLIALDVLTIAAALFAGYSAELFLANRQILLPLLSLTFLAIFSVFGALLTRHFGRRFFILILQAMALTFPFYDSKLINLWLLVAGLVLIFLLWGELLSRRELNNGLEIKFFRTAAPTVNKMVTAVIFMTIIFYLPQWNEKSIFFPPDSFRALFNWSGSFANNFYPEINLQSSVGDLGRSLALYQLKGNLVYKNMPPAAQEQILSQAAEQAINGISNAAGITVSRNEAVSEVVYDFIVSRLKNWSEKFGSGFLAAWALAVFLIARSFGVIFSWLSQLLMFVLYQLFLALNVLRITGETRVKEVLEFS